ncbi:BlaI/MecI/CopY family transcriptional regulator [bacterium]|nr:BlaI/MecI/CopY family transcriptional regulator [bacterium]
MKKSLFYSLFLHALAALLFLRIYLPISKPGAKTEMEWRFEEVVQPQMFASPKASNKELTRMAGRVPAPPEHTAEEEAVSADAVVMEPQPPAAPDSVPPAVEMVYSSSYFNKELLQKPVADSSRCSLMAMDRKAIGSNLEPLMGSKYDGLAERSRESLSRTPAKPLPLSDIGMAVARQLKPKTPSRPALMRFVPSQNELAVLKTIWEKGSITDQEIYARLDTSIKLTAVDVNALLKGLEAKGVLMSEIISPRDELTFNTPLGGIAVEKSAQNRRNRVYRYRSLIDRKHMIRFLQAKLDQARNRNYPYATGRRDSAAAVAGLQKKILQVLQ